MIEILLLLVTACTSISPQSCSVALKEIAEQDQKARQNFLTMSKEELMALRESDAQRRIQVRKLEKKNCLRSKEDFAHAALVFQHGETPEDFHQAFEWSKKAEDKSMVALTLDRFLVKSGKRQLFGSQASKSSGSDCWCLEDTEVSFPDEVRKEYTGKKFSHQVQWVKILNGGKKCPVFCGKLSETEKGYLPGVW